jgi:hypothetical protein
MILLCLLHLQSSTQVKNSNPLEGAVGSVIETNIEGIDREFKVTKAQKAFFLQ